MGGCFIWLIDVTASYQGSGGGGICQYNMCNDHHRLGPAVNKMIQKKKKMPGNHSLMHPNTVRDASNRGDELEIVNNDPQPVAPLEDVETAEEECSE